MKYFKQYMFHLAIRKLSNKLLSTGLLRNVALASTGFRPCPDVTTAKSK